MNLIDQFIQAAQHAGNAIQGNPIVQGVEKDIQDPMNIGRQEISAINNSPIGQSPAVKQMTKSPLSQALQGNWNGILPAIQGEISDINSGKYKPQLSWGGEMEEVPGASLPKITAPKTDLPSLQNEQPQESYPFTQKPSTLSRVGLGQDQATRQIRLPASISGASVEQSVHDTLDRLGFKGNADQQYSQLSSKMSDVAKWIENKSSLATNPKNIPIDEVKQSFLDNLGDMFRRGEITTKVASKEISGYINNLYDAARKATAPNISGINTTNGEWTNIIPDSISSPDVYNMKKLANADTSSVFKKLANNTALSDLDKVLLSGRNALDDIISKYHPDVKQATTDMSNLYSAAPSLEKARLNPPQTPQLVDIPVLKGLNKPLNQAITNVGQGAARAFANPAVRTGALIAGGAGLGAGADFLYNTFANKNNPLDNGSNDAQYNQNSNNNNKEGDNAFSQTNHSGIVSQSYNNIKPDPKTGAIELPQTPPIDQNTRHYMTTQDYQTGLEKLAQQYPAGTSNPHYTVAKNLLDTQFTNDQKQADEVFKGNNIKNFMDNAIQYNNAGKDLLGTLHTLPVGFWNGVSKAGSIRAYSDPSYANELQQIDSFNNEFTSAYTSVTGEKPTDNQLLNSANSPAQAAQKYVSMMQFIAGTYGKYLAPYSALTSATGTQTNSGTPQPLNALPPIQVAPQNANSIVGGTPPPAQYNNGQWSLPAIQ